MNTHLSKKKKWLAYLIGFLIMICCHYLIGNKPSHRPYRGYEYQAEQFLLCLDQITQVPYYRLNCPVCKQLITQVKVSKA